MKISRRGLINGIGVGALAGVGAGGSLWSRPLLAQGEPAKVYDNGIMQLNQNESARGPGPKTLEAIRKHTNFRIGRGYAPDHVNELRDLLADMYGQPSNGVILATGSTPILEGAVRAFCTAERGLVTAGPTYATCEGTARRIGVPVNSIQVDDDGYLNLDGMAAAAPGAGLVYLCNPNNPTGTVYGPAAIEAFVRKVMAANPTAHILIDEAYIAYVAPSLMETALPLTREFANVFISRSFSKAHGMAGLRVGYALGAADTLNAITSAWNMGDVNMLAAIAAITAAQDKEHLEWEREENAQIRAMVVGAFKDMGFSVPDSQTNHIFPNLRRPAAEFRAACLQEKIAVGRDFPPLHETHSRISLGSREEMQRAVEVFRKVLS